MLTHNPDTVQTVEDGVLPVAGEMVVRVVHGELVTGPELPGELARSAGGAVRWLDRVAETGRHHHAVGNYLAEERPIGTRFDRYV